MGRLGFWLYGREGFLFGNPVQGNRIHSDTGINYTVDMRLTCRQRRGQSRKTGPTAT